MVAFVAFQLHFPGTCAIHPGHERLQVTSEICQLPAHRCSQAEAPDLESIGGAPCGRARNVYVGIGEDSDSRDGYGRAPSQHAICVQLRDTFAHATSEEHAATSQTSMAKQAVQY